MASTRTDVCYRSVEFIECSGPNRQTKQTRLATLTDPCADPNGIQLTS